MFLGGIDNTDINRATDSRLSSIFGGSGLTTGSASAMGEFERQANLEKQQRRIGAYRGAQESGYSDLNALQNMLTGTQGFRSNNLQNLFGATNAQYAPFANLMNMITPSMQYNQNLTQFDMDKISGRVDLANQLAAARAQPRSGLFQRVVEPAVSAYGSYKSFTGG